MTQLRRKISFDCDGVIAEGGWVAVPDRTNAFYSKKPPVSEEVVPALRYLSAVYDIYVISTRGHAGANIGLRAWLHWVLGLELDSIAGVITYPNQGPDDEHRPMDKAGIVNALGIELHVDDDPHHVDALGTRGLLYPSDMPVSKAAAGISPTVGNWEDLVTFLMTPNFQIHGTNGVTVTSPAKLVRTVEGVVVQ